MPIQRTCGAENQVRNKLSNGPLRVQSNVRNHRVFCNVRAYVSCRGYVGILIRAWLAHECKVAPRISCYIRPWQKVSFCRGRFFVHRKILCTKKRSAKDAQLAARKLVAMQHRSRAGMCEAHSIFGLQCPKVINHMCLHISGFMTLGHATI